MTALLADWLACALSVGLAVAAISGIYILFGDYYGTSDIKREAVIAAVTGAILALVDRGIDTYLGNWEDRGYVFWALGGLVLYTMVWSTHREDLEELDAAYLILVWVPCTLLVGTLRIAFFG